MSLNLVIDIVEESGIASTYQGLRLTEHGTRVAIVKGLTTGGSTDAATALSRAKNFAIAQYPPFTLYPGATTAYLLSHAAVPIPQTDDAAKIIMTYDTPSIPPPGSPFVVTDDYEEVGNTTNLLPGQNGGLANSPGQIALVWQDPANNKLSKVDFPTVGYDSTVRKIELTGYVRGANIGPFRGLYNMTNSDTFLGLPPGYWRAQVNTSTQDLGSTYKVNVVLHTKVTVDWSVTVVLKDLNNNRTIGIPPGEVTKCQSRGYRPGGIFQGNGIMRMGYFGWTPFNPLFPGLSVAPAT